MAKKTLTKKPEKLYKVTACFNGETITCETDDLNETIESLKPFNLKTRVLFRIEKDGKVCDKILNGFIAKQVFRNRLFRGIFINRLIYK